MYFKYSNGKADTNFFDKGKREGMIIRHILIFLYVIALAASAGHFLFNVEVDEPCEYFDREDNEFIDVAKRYEIVLKLLFSVGIIEIFRQLFAILGLFLKSAPLFAVSLCFGCNGCLYFATFITGCVFRFNTAGKACAEEPFLAERAEYLQGMLIAMIVLDFVFFCTFCLMPVLTKCCS